jgi:hypothetical protein
MGGFAAYLDDHELQQSWWPGAIFQQISPKVMPVDLQFAWPLPRRPRSARWIGAAAAFGAPAHVRDTTDDDATAPGASGAAGSRQSAAYRELIGIAEEVVASATAAVETAATMRGTDLLAVMRIAALREEIAHYCGLGAQVIDQARRRVLDGEYVPTAEKIYSISEPDTDLIKRGKVKTPVEFGHKVFLAESAKGLITQYEYSRETLRMKFM